LLDESPDAIGGIDGAAGAGDSPAVPATRFRIQGLLARGGIGQVMRAVDSELNREVAVKEIQPALANNHEVRARFLREAEITGQLEHPGIVPVYGLGRDAAGQPFYAMRLVRGQTFQEAAAEFHRQPVSQHRFHGLEFQKLLRRFLHVCQTVAYAHSRGVIHRDLKPENILLGPYGETLVVDWGLARVTGAIGDERLPLGAPEKGERREIVPGTSLTTPLAPWSSELTRDAGEWIGTPAYMSPEQAEGGAHGVGPTSDVYGLGATLYVLLTGAAPLSGFNVPETLRRAMAGEFPRPRNACRCIPLPLEAICLKALARRPEDRYASPSTLADDLERWLADEPVTVLRDTVVARAARWGRRHRTPVVVGAIALLVLTAISLVAAVLINGERLRANRQRIEADRRTARLAFDRGYALTETHEHGAALLWFARALSHAPQTDADLRRVILTNMDAARQQLLRRQGEFTHDATLSTAAISADGQQLATADHRGQLCLWDVGSGNKLAERSIGSRRAIAAHLTADGRALFATVMGRTFTLEMLQSDSADGDARPAISLPVTDEVACAAFSPDGSLLVTGSRASGVSVARLWRVPSGEPLTELPHPRSVSQIVFRPQHGTIATVGSEGGVRLWNADGTLLTPEIKLEAGRVERIDFTPDGKRMLVGNSEGAFFCFDVETRRRLFELARASGSITAVACAPDGQTVAAAWSNGMVRTFDLAERRQSSEVLRIDRYTGFLAFRSQTRQMLISSEPQSVVLWDIPDTSPLSLPLGQGQLSTIAFSPDGKWAVTGSRNGTAQLRDAATGKPLGRVMKHEGVIPLVAFRPDGAVVLTVSYDGTAQLWNSASGHPHGAAMDHRTGRGNVEVQSAAFSHDGQFVVTGDNVGIVRIWDGNTGKLVNELDRQVGAVRSIRFNKRGDRIVAGWGTPDNGVRLWNFASRKLLWTARHQNTVRTVDISPDGRLVLSASNDETARLWNAADGRPVGSALVHRGEVFVAAFSPDGTVAVTGGYDATARFWSVPSGAPLGEPMRHSGVVMSAIFSNDGTLLLTGGSVDRSARLWDVATCLPLSPPLLSDEPVLAVGLQPSGRTAYTGRLWRLPTPLADEPVSIQVWAKLATQRTFAGDNIEWLSPADLAAAASEFQARTGTTWDQWGE
jgi:WD40 repeat protein/serine/threonine protein kinase